MSELSASAAGQLPAESHLGRALILLNRAAVRLDEPARRGEAVAALRAAAGLVESALQALEGSVASAQPGAQRVDTSVDGPVAAVIAAAVSVYLERPYRLVSVQRVTAPVVPHLNVWAVEGRTQIFMSHKVR